MKKAFDLRHLWGIATMMVFAAAVAAPTNAPAPASQASQAAIPAYKAETTIVKEVFTAKGTVKTAGGAETSAPVTITIEGRTSEADRQKLIEALKSGGTPAVRKALEKMKEVGSIQVGSGSSPLRYCYVRELGGGARLITLGADHPLFFLGADAKLDKPKEGYDLAIIDLDLDGAGTGNGTLAGAAKLMLTAEGALRVEDYSVNLIWLKSVAKTAQ